MWWIWGLVFTLVIILGFEIRNKDLFDHVIELDDSIRRLSDEIAKLREELMKR